MDSELPPGDPFPGQELALELVETAAYAETRIEAAVELTSRLPRTLAGLAAGTIDLTRATTIALHTLALPDADAACADEVLASAAASKRPDQLARKAATLELKLAPDAVQARLTQGRNPLGRIQPLPAPLPVHGSAVPGPAPAPPDPAPQGAAPGSAAAPDPQPSPAPLPALVNLVQAASRHPRTRRCLTVTGTDGTALAHGCAPGQHPWTTSPASPEDSTGPPPLLELLRALDLTLRPVARGTCDHAQAESRYAPGRTLQHLARARRPHPHHRPD